LFAFTGDTLQVVPAEAVSATPWELGLLTGFLETIFGWVI
jgi:hypothetical protein